MSRRLWVPGFSFIVSFYGDDGWGDLEFWERQTVLIVDIDYEYKTVRFPLDLDLIHRGLK